MSKSIVTCVWPVVSFVCLNYTLPEFTILIMGQHKNKYKSSRHLKMPLQKSIDSMYIAKDY